MKKSLKTLILSLLLFLPFAFVMTACGEKQEKEIQVYIDDILITDTNNVVEIDYGQSFDLASKLVVKILYDDNSLEFVPNTDYTANVSPNMDVIPAVDTYYITIEYKDKKVEAKLVVKPATFNSSLTMKGYTYGETPNTPSISANFSGGYVKYYYNTSNTTEGAIEWQKNNPPALNAGKYYMYAVISAKNNYSAVTTSLVEFTVAPKQIAKPTEIENTTFNGNIQTIDASMFGLTDDQVVLRNNQQIDAGEHTVYVGIKGGNYVWEDGSNTEIALKWNIEKASLSKPSLSLETEDNYYVYNGNEKVVTLQNFNPDIMDINLLNGVLLSEDNSQLKAINAGVYSAVISIKDEAKKNYEWADESTLDSQVSFAISKAKVSIPTLTDERQSSEYAGGSQSVTLNNYDSSVMTINYDDEKITYTAPVEEDDDHTLSASDAGVHTVKFTLKDSNNYEWSTSVTNGVVTLNFVIDKKVVSVSITNQVYTGSEINVFAKDGETYTIISGYDEKVMSYDITNNNPNDNKNYTDKATIPGDYYINFKLKDAENYKWASQTEKTEEISIRWSISRKPIALPTLVLDETENYYVYNGSNKIVTLNGFDANAMTISVSEGATIDDNTISATNAGEYTITVTPSTNYMWNDLTLDNLYGDIQFSFTIAKAKVTKPTITDERINTIYTGASQGVTITGFDENTMTKAGDTATDIGDYTATISLSNPNNYEWADGTSEDIALAWSITSNVVDKSTLALSNTENFVYDGEEKSVTLNGFDSSTMEVVVSTGANLDGNIITATNAGTYTITISLKTPYVWSDDSTEDIEFTFTINKAKVTVPTIEDENKSIEYTGESIAVEITNFDSNTMTKAGDVATSVGNYSVIISLNDTDNYEWTEGGVENITLDWFIIAPKLTEPTLTKSQDSGYYVYTGEEKSVTLNGFDSNTMEVVVSTGATIDGNIITATNAGTYTITISLKTPYVWSDDSTEDIVLSFTIDKAKVTKPTIEDNRGGNTTYTGELQSVTITGFDENTMTKTGDAATDVGNYTAIISLKDSDNYEWSDGGVDNITLDWSISSPGLAAPTLSQESEGYVYNGNAQSVTLNGFDSETMTASVSDGATIDGTTISATNAGTYIITIALKDKTSDKWANGTADDITLEFEIAKAENVITKFTISSWLTSKASNNSPQLTAIYGADTVTYEYKLATADDSEYQEFSALINTVGIYTLKATIAESANYLTVSAETVFEVYDRTDSISITYSGADTKYYDYSHSLYVIPKTFSGDFKFNVDFPEGKSTISSVTITYTKSQNNYSKNGEFVYKSEYESDENKADKMNESLEYICISSSVIAEIINAAPSIITITIEFA